MAAGHGKRLEWSPSALDAYLATLRHIASEDPRAAELVSERVERALAQILEYPGLGTPALRRGERRFPVRKTGHVIHYKVMRQAIRIQVWYRARQHMKLGL